MRFTTTLTIDAPPDLVWSILTDLDRWTDWNPSVDAVTRLDDGVLDVGSATRVKQPGMPALVWHVTELALGRAFTWEARSGGIVTIARHDISPADGGGSEVTLGIDQRGPIAWLLHLCFGGRTRRYVEAEARGLKRRAEVA